MKNNLIFEIKRNQQLMGLLIEGKPPILTISDEIVKGLKSLIKRPNSLVSQDIDLLAQIANRTKKASQDELVNLLTRLIRSDKKIADYLIPKIIANLDVNSQNFISTFKTRILNFKATGGTYEDALRNIKVHLNAYKNGVPVFNTPIPEIKNYLKKDLEDFAWETFNPGKSKSINVAKDIRTGFKEGWKSKSGGFLTLRAIRNLLTPNAIEKYFPSYFQKLTPEERKVMWQWIYWGVPDRPSLQKTLKTLGLPGAFGNASAQLLSKTLWMMSIYTFFQFCRDYVSDISTEEEEYKGWSQFAAFCHRVVRAFDMPRLGVNSPAFWLIGLIIEPIWAGVTGATKKYKERFMDYLIGEDEKNIPQTPENVKDFFKGFISNTDSLITKTKGKIDNLRQGQNVDTSDILPDTVTLPKWTDSSSVATTQPTDSTGGKKVDSTVTNKLNKLPTEWTP